MAEEDRIGQELMDLGERVPRLIRDAVTLLEALVAHRDEIAAA